MTVNPDRQNNHREEDSTSTPPSADTKQPDYEIATLRRRILAATLDTFLVYALLIIGYIPLWAWALSRGQTPGKFLLGIHVVMEETGEPTKWRYTFVREFVVKAVLGTTLAIATFGVSWVIDSLWPFWDPKHRTLHDRLLGTLVARNRRSIRLTPAILGVSILIAAVFFTLVVLLSGCNTPNPAYPAPPTTLPTIATTTTPTPQATYTPAPTRTARPTTPTPFPSATQIPPPTATPASTATRTPRPTPIYYPLLTPSLPPTTSTVSPQEAEAYYERLSTIWDRCYESLKAGACPDAHICAQYLCSARSLSDQIITALVNADLTPAQYLDLEYTDFSVMLLNALMKTTTPRSSGLLFTDTPTDALPLANTLVVLESPAGQINGFIVTDTGIVATIYAPFIHITTTTVRIQSECEYKANLVAADRQQNIALFQMDNSRRYSHLILADDKPGLNENELTTLHYSHGKLPLRKSTRKLIDPDSYNSDIEATAMLLDSPPESRNAGAPAFASNGKVLGMLTTETAAADQFTSVIHARHIIEILQPLQP